ncbi:hypothetical protein FRC07_014100 [Ceratobasidium sp. 392]|nr:hypothetical protein FRC07_014100 [Ceratobasidium sp. 392]
MNIQPKWLRDLAAMAFSVYYIIYANEADEKLRKYRATASIETLRATWEKSSKNPWIRALSYAERPGLPVVRKLVLSRPGSEYPITAWLFFSHPAQELKKQRELILDFPGGGFIAMSPLDHEERLRRWAIRTGRPVLSVDYHKAPEYPYPFAIDEAYDTYKLLVESKGRILGMAGDKFSVVLTGDSAGANICCNILFKILETPPSSKPLPKPVSVVLNYAALDFNFTSWMAPAHLKVLRSQASQGHIPGLEDMKDHFSGQGPLDVADRSASRGRKSWTGDSVKGWTEGMGPPSPIMRMTRSPDVTVGRKAGRKLVWGEPEQYEHDEEEEKPVKMTIGTRLTMTSRTGFFQDRIISPSMNPDFKTDYRISPILAPSTLLAEFPRLLMTCGEKDPFVDDTVVFAGRIREAKRAKKLEGSRFGEGLRMSRNEREAEDAEWVHMHIFEGWSHGYLQMAALMHEARDAIDDIAGWIIDAFACETEREREREREEEAEVLTFTPRKRRSPPGSVDAARRVDGVAAQVPALDSEPRPVNGGRGRLSAPLPLASLTEQELMRRRRMEAVAGIGEGVVEDSAVASDDEREEMRIAYGY